RKGSSELNPERVEDIVRVVDLLWIRQHGNRITKRLRVRASVCRVHLRCFSGPCPSVPADAAVEVKDRNVPVTKVLDQAVDLDSARRSRRWLGWLAPVRAIPELAKRDLAERVVVGGCIDK